MPAGISKKSNRFSECRTVAGFIAFHSFPTIPFYHQREESIAAIDSPRCSLVSNSSLQFKSTIFFPAEVHLCSLKRSISQSCRKKEHHAGLFPPLFCCELMLTGIPFLTVPVLALPGKPGSIVSQSKKKRVD